MKKTLIIALVSFLVSLGLFSFAEAATRVRGYYKRSNGSYVQPHYRSSPNSSKFDNWSTKGNINPYSGKRGYNDPFRSYRFRY